MTTDPRESVFSPVAGGRQSEIDFERESLLRMVPHLMNAAAKLAGVGRAFLENEDESEYETEWQDLKEFEEIYNQIAAMKPAQDINARRHKMADYERAKTMNHFTQAYCPKCQGHGYPVDEPVKHCSVCLGSGVVSRPAPSLDGCYHVWHPGRDGKPYCIKCGKRQYHGGRDG